MSFDLGLTGQRALRRRCIVGAKTGSIEIDGMRLRGETPALFFRRARRPRRLCFEPGGKIRFTGEW